MHVEIIIKHTRAFQLSKIIFYRQGVKNTIEVIILLRVPCAMDEALSAGT